MSACTFFGHRDCPESIKPQLREMLVNLIENHAVDTFYVGNQGGFDYMVCALLRELSQQYPHISYSVVLAYLPTRRDEFDTYNFSDTMLPEGIEAVPKRFAISWRNKWMIRHSDFVVTYIVRSWGGAAQFAEAAEKQGKTILRLGDR